MGDLRLALRTLRARPGFAAAAVLTLALGIGATTAIFSVVYGVLMRPLPYPHAEELVWWGGSQPDLEDVTARTDVFAASSITASNRYAVDMGNGAEEMRGDVVTPSFFDVVGMRPALGRTFTAADETERIAVVSDQLWRSHYGADRQVLGKTIRLNGKAYTIVGVMPPALRLPSPETVLWTPLAEALIGWPEKGNRQLRIFRGTARLAPGVDLQRAQAAVSTVMLQIAKEHPRTNAGVGMELHALHEAMVSNVRPALLLLLGTVALVLLLAAGNVANLSLARAASRERELATRLALGAGRGRLARLMLTESVVLALIGGALGVLIALWGVEILQGLSPTNVPRLDAVKVDAPVLLFALGVSVATGLLFGLAPVLGVVRPPLSSLMQAARGATEGRRGGWLRQALVVGEVGLSLVVVAGALLLVTSFVNLLRADRGFRSEGLLTFSMPPGAQQGPDGQVLLAQVLARLAALPGVESVGGANSLPPATLQRVARYVRPGLADGTPAPQTPWIIVTPDYFRALGADVLAGRAFTAADVEGTTPVMIINRSLARSLYGDGDAIGQRLKLLQPGLDAGARTIVGVVNDIKYTGLDQDGEIAVFTPWAQTPWPGMYVAVRTRGEPMALARAVREAIASVDGTQSVAAMRSMDAVTARSLSQPRFYTLVLGMFGVVALALAVIGVYGVIAYQVAQRRREIGIRVALGARPASVVGMIVRHGARLAAAGIALGLLGAVGATRILSGMLYGVRPADPRVMVATAALLVAVALAASFFAARRAAHVDPMTALRAD